MAKITDLTKSYGNGKWVEVLTLSTDNPTEEPSLIAKFRSLAVAREFAKWFNEQVKGYTGIIIR